MEFTCSPFNGHATADCPPRPSCCRRPTLLPSSAAAGATPPHVLRHDAPPGENPIDWVPWLGAAARLKLWQPAAAVVPAAAAAALLLLAAPPQLGQQLAPAGTGGEEAHAAAVGTHQAEQGRLSGSSPAPPVAAVPGSAAGAEPSGRGQARGHEADGSARPFVLDGPTSCALAVSMVVSGAPLAQLPMPALSAAHADTAPGAPPTSAPAPATGGGAGQLGGRGRRRLHRAAHVPGAGLWDQGLDRAVAGRDRGEGPRRPRCPASPSPRHTGRSPRQPAPVQDGWHTGTAVPHTHIVLLGLCCPG